MQIDITRLLLNQISTINITSDVVIPNELITDIRIDSLNNLYFEGKLSLNEDNNLYLYGDLSGVMILKDDLTLEPVNYNFKTDVEEIIENRENIIDITDIIWQNIVLSVPSKVRKSEDNIYLSGNGWRVLSEEQYNAMRQNDNPFSDLGEILNIKEDK